MAAAMQENADRFYPSAQEVDDWCNVICARTDAVTVQGEELTINNITPPFGNGPNARVNTYVRFTASDGRRGPRNGPWPAASMREMAVMIGSMITAMAKPVAWIIR